MSTRRNEMKGLPEAKMFMSLNTQHIKLPEQLQARTMTLVARDNGAMRNSMPNGTTMIREQTEHQGSAADEVKHFDPNSTSGSAILHQLTIASQYLREPYHDKTDAFMAVADDIKRKKLSLKDVTVKCKSPVQGLTN